MGSITVQHFPASVSNRSVEVWDGPLIDFLEDRWPNGFVAKDGEPIPAIVYDLKTGKEIVGPDLEGPVGHRQIAIGLSPGGLDPFTIFLITVAVVSVTVAATLLFMPKPFTGADQEQGASAYSVSAQANRAKLGGVIPDQIGRYTRCPEYASQSYRVFENNEETRYFLLCLGVGDYQVNGIRIGDTPAGDNVTWEVYKPSEHTSTLGVIDADFGIHENVFTSGEVDNIELKGGSVLSQTVSVTTANGNPQLTINTSGFPFYAAKPGYTVTISGSAGIDDDYIVDSIDLESDAIIMTTNFGASTTSESVTISIFKESVDRGPYVTNPAGTTTGLIEIDIENPGGLFIANDDSTFSDAEIEITASVQEIDDAGADVGSPTSHVFTIADATKDHLRESFQIDKSANPGRFEITLTRTDDADFRPRDSDKTVWSGLKAYLDYDTEATVYGNVTLVAMKITAAQESSSSAQQRIFIDSTRLINQLGTESQVAGGNLADAFAYVVEKGASSDNYDSTALAAFRTAQSSRSGFNGVFDTQLTYWDALEAICTLGRARPYPVGSELSVVVDEVKSRSSIVTPYNIIEGSPRFQLNMFDPDDNDGVEVEYRDILTGSARYAIWPADSLNPQRSKPIGLGDEDEAASMAKYIWRQKTLRSMSIDWSTSRDGRNWKPFDVVGVVMPLFDWGDAALVRDADDTTVTLNTNAPSGALSVVFRDQDGTASSVVTATGDGTNVIELDSSPPITLVHDGQSQPTMCAIGLTADFEIVDALIGRIVPSGSETKIEAVNYDAAVYTGLV